MHRDDRPSAEEKKVLEEELSALIDAFVDDLSALIEKEYEVLLDSIYIDLSDEPSTSGDAAYRVAISSMKAELHELRLKRADLSNETKSGREGRMSKPRRR